MLQEGFFILGLIPLVSAQSEEGLVKWLTFKEAQELNKKQPSQPSQPSYMNKISMRGEPDKIETKEKKNKIDVNNKKVSGQVGQLGQV